MHPRFIYLVGYVIACCNLPYEANYATGREGLMRVPDYIWIPAAWVALLMLSYTLVALAVLVLAFGHR